MQINEINEIDSKKMYRTYDDWPEIAKNSFRDNMMKLDISDIDHIVFAGMGGSGSIGDTIGSILSKEDIHVSNVKGYLLPKTVDSRTLVIATSVSGNTSETLSVLSSLQNSSAKVVGFSSGGLMEKYCKNNEIFFQKIPMIHSPRASFPSFLYSILGALEEILPIRQQDILESIRLLEHTRDNIFSGNLVDQNKALELAKFVDDVICIYYPSGLKAVATRYKNSLQENTKIHVMTEDVIETCHNGIVSWQLESNVKPILIQGKDDHSKTRERWVILREYLESKNVNYKIVNSEEGSILSKITNLIYLLDYSSIYSSILRKIDPSPVEAIDFIKKRL